MSQWEKLMYKLKKLSPDMRFEELQKILESYGYEMQSPRSGSSHFSFRKKGKAVITCFSLHYGKRRKNENFRRIHEAELSS